MLEPQAVKEEIRTKSQRVSMPAKIGIDKKYASEVCHSLVTSAKNSEQRKNLFATVPIVQEDATVSPAEIQDKTLPRKQNDNSTTKSAA